MHFCVDEAMALVALLGSALHFWRCECTNVKQRFRRFRCYIFGHPSVREVGAIYKMGGIYCRRCSSEMYL
jgi:hypothetical protein